jgi:hypothetical protein
MSVCSFCIHQVEKRLVCGGCRTRLYCSAECQREDWNTNGKGQGHKHWCKEQSGEEYLDWDVVHIDDAKGLGIIAKRDIPMHYRIMVERVFTRPNEHPAIADLMPEGTSLYQKFQLNAMSCLPVTLSTPNPPPSGVCLRMSRVNHSCDENAYHQYARVGKIDYKILLASRDIKAGDEITIQYSPWNALNSSAIDPKSRIMLLHHKWGIDCPSDCVCKTADYALIERARQLDASIMDHASSLRLTEALVAVTKLLKVKESLNASLPELTRTLYDGFQLGIAKQSLQGQAFLFVRRKYEMEVIIGTKKCESALKVQEWLEHPETHPNWRGC